MPSRILLPSSASRLRFRTWSDRIAATMMVEPHTAMLVVIPGTYPGASYFGSSVHRAALPTVRGQTYLLAVNGRSDDATSGAKHDLQCTCHGALITLAAVVGLPCQSRRNQTIDSSNAEERSHISARERVLTACSSTIHEEDDSPWSGLLEISDHAHTNDAYRSLCGNERASHAEFVGQSRGHNRSANRKDIRWCCQEERFCLRVS